MTSGIYSGKGKVLEGGNLSDEVVGPAGEGKRVFQQEVLDLDPNRRKISFYPELENRSAWV